MDNLKKKTYVTALGILKSKEDSINEIKDKILKGHKVQYREVNKSNTSLLQTLVKMNT